MNTTNRPLTSTSRTAIGALLVAAMLATRLGHFGGLPDASWAVLFVGGVYLRSAFAFLLLMVEAVGIDWLATQQMGISSYCISPAYLFLLPAYGSLWLGGWWLGRTGIPLRLPTLARLATVLLVAASLCFLLSDGSFYWLSGRVTDRSIAGWLANDAIWYPAFMETSFLYVGAAAVLHTTVTLIQRGTAARTA